MKTLLFALVFSFGALAYNPMGEDFYNAKTKDKVVLTCGNFQELIKIFRNEM